MGSTNDVIAVNVSYYCRPPFDRLDKLCVCMLHPDTGVGQKQQKYFRLSVPQSFTGAELIQWLLTNMKLDDAVEALHMATVLREHGYLFPVIDRLAPIKDDNTLYRFQAPYFWASHSGSPDDVEYAIYLAKRLLRNEEKHGLEPHEADVYNRLCELHGNKYDYISVAAEMQLKLHKDKKKPDKVVFDSQERAYWLLHRPPPPRNSCNLEVEIGKMKKRIKRKTAKHYLQEIQILQCMLKTKPHFKAAKSTETLVQWCEQFGEHDPFLSGCSPSNPWISDDTSYWLYNAEIVDIPTERRVKRWGFSVQEIVNDPIGRQVLESFLDTEFSSENIRFWIAVQDLKYSPNSDIEKKIEYLYKLVPSSFSDKLEFLELDTDNTLIRLDDPNSRKQRTQMCCFRCLCHQGIPIQGIDHLEFPKLSEYLAPGASCQVNIDNKCLDMVHKQMKESTHDTQRPLRYCYSEAEEQIFGLMAKDSYLRFVRSEIFKNVLNAAQQQGAKRQGWRNIINFNTSGSAGASGPSSTAKRSSTAPNPGKIETSKNDVTDV